MGYTLRAEPLLETVSRRLENYYASYSRSVLDCIQHIERLEYERDKARGLESATLDALAPCSDTVNHTMLAFHAEMSEILVRQRKGVYWDGARTSSRKEEAQFYDRRDVLMQIWTREIESAMASAMRKSLYVGVAAQRRLRDACENEFRAEPYWKVRFPPTPSSNAPGKRPSPVALALAKLKPSKASVAAVVVPARPPGRRGLGGGQLAEKRDPACARRVTADVGGDANATRREAVGADSGDATLKKLQEDREREAAARRELYAKILAADAEPERQCGYGACTFPERRIQRQSRGSLEAYEYECTHNCRVVQHRACWELATREHIVGAYTPCLTADCDGLLLYASTLDKSHVVLKRNVVLK